MSKMFFFFCKLYLASNGGCFSAQGAGGASYANDGGRTAPPYLFNQRMWVIDWCSESFCAPPACPPEEHVLGGVRAVVRNGMPPDGNLVSDSEID